ncbi:MAG: transglutaminase domain-containing protein [Christensenellaceae bacterium]|nr:transglutaminase domain-containing protein [Christensenellaceae bacterium]
MPDSQRQRMEFLLEHLPLSDIINYPLELFLQFADHALFLRKNIPWCAELDQEIFDHYVLFPRVNDEDLSFHRKLFYDTVWPRIRGIHDARERILEVNRWCHEIASYEAQDERTASPLTVFRNGSGRCGEESAFLVSSLRSVGIPARQVYAPRWLHCDDNHAWVEALCCGEWHFLGACEPEPILDRGWFNTPASRAILVHSRIFGTGSSPLHGKLLSRAGAVTWYNQTPRYACVHEYIFHAMKNGLPAAGAQFQVQVLNEASFHTIATLTADDNGEAKAEFGTGSIHCLAMQDGLWAEGDADAETTELTLNLAPHDESDTDWIDFNVYAPQASSKNPAPLSLEQQIQRETVLKHGKALREARMKGFIPDLSQNLPLEWEDSIEHARGNSEEILKFLRGGNYSEGGSDQALDDTTRQRGRFLETITKKDLRDTDHSVLEAHFAQRPPLSNSIPEEIYWQYVASPRIALEKLTAWRETLNHIVGSFDVSDLMQDPSALWHWLDSVLEITNDGLYDNLYFLPARSLLAGCCDEKSKALLFAAALRTLGIPARLRPLDNTAEYYKDGRFQTIFAETSGTLRLICPENMTPLYNQNWTLCRRDASGWKKLELCGVWDANDGITPTAKKIELPTGYYRLITSVRLPNGNQFASKRNFPINEGETVEIRLRLRTYALDDMLRLQHMPETRAETLDGVTIPDMFRMFGRPTLLIWLEEGSEPTEHVLNELEVHQRELENLPIDIAFLVRGMDSLLHPMLSKMLSGWKNLRILLDNWAYDMENIARCLTCDPDTPPLAIVCDGEGRAVYGVSGYHVGSVELLTRVAASLCDKSVLNAD